MRCVATLRWVMTMGVGGDHEVCGDQGIGTMILCYGDHLKLTIDITLKCNPHSWARNMSAEDIICH